MAAIVRIEAATFVRPGGEVVFRDLNWEILEGQAWAIVGPVGSGKTALTDVLLGRFRLETGSMTWPLLDRLRAQGRSITWPSEVIQRVSFKEESRLFSYGRHYYQQRFNFIEPLDDLTLDTFLRSGTTALEGELDATATLFGIQDLRALSLIKLSNGQVRRARLARALLAEPEWLILDDPFMGLDIQARGEVAALLGKLHERGMRLLLITRPDLIPSWITDVKTLGRAEGVNPPCILPTTASDHGGLTPSARQENAPILEFHNVSVTYGERAVLRDLSWTVRAGERWAVLGPNGSGKTTLLSLICGDHPQAYGNDLWLFGRKRGSGESIWEIKSRIGLVSPEMHLYFSEPLTAQQAATTGFFDALVCRATTLEQDAAVRELFDHFHISHLLTRLFSRLSTGEQRLVLLLRALVKRPPLLILDEPFQGFDAELIGLAQRWLAEELRPDQTLLFVTHHAEEIPPSVDRHLSLAAAQSVSEEAGTSSGVGLLH